MLEKTKKEIMTYFVRVQSIGLWLTSTKFRYQPLPSALSIPGFRFQGTRLCDDRLRIIMQHLPEGTGNVLDLGSNSGYYLLELSKLGYRCHGIEPDPELVFFASLMSYVTGARGISCERSSLDLALIERMPSYDVVLCLSLMHHIILAQGMGVAESILRRLATKTNHALFFEMGQSNEIDADWAKRLPRMEPDPETWISQWLIRSGFRHVKTIGTSPTTVSRFLFAAYP